MDLRSVSSTKLYAFGLIGGLAIALIAIATVYYFSPHTQTSDIVSNKISTATSSTVSFDESHFIAWHRIEPTDDLFQIFMPGSPSESRTDIPIKGSDISLMQENFSAQDEQGNGYFVTALIYPQPFSKEQTHTVLESALEGMRAAVTGNELRRADYTPFKDMPSVDFAIENGTQNYQGKLMIKGRVLYEVFVAYEDGHMPDESYLYFLKTFEPQGR